MSKLREENFELDKDHALSLEFKYVNYTAGPHGLLPTPLVFCYVLRLHVKPQEFPDQNSHIKGIIIVRKGMASLAAQSTLECALRRNVLSAAVNYIPITHRLPFLDVP